MQIDIDSEIYTIVKRSNTRLAIYSLIGVIIIVVCTNFFLWPFWVGQLNDPISIRGDALLTLSDNTTLYNYKVSSTDMFDTGYEEYTESQSGSRISTDAFFGLLQINTEQYLLVRTKNAIDESVHSYTGTIKPIPSAIQREVVDDLIQQLTAEDITGIIIMPIMLDTIPDNSLWYVGTFALAVIALVTAWGIFTFLKRGNPPNHPILKKLSRFGDVELVVDSIEKDRAMGEVKVGKLYLTRNWAFTKTRTSFDAMSLGDTLWAYQQITQHRTNGIPTGKSYALHIYDKHGAKQIIAGKEAQMLEMLQAIMTRAPWIIAGYSDQIRDTWNRNRAAFIAEVERRRNEVR